MITLVASSSVFMITLAKWASYKDGFSPGLVDLLTETLSTKPYLDNYSFKLASKASLYSSSLIFKLLINKNLSSVVLIYLLT